MRRRWILLPVLGVAGYFAVFGGEYSWLDLRRLEKERRAQETAVKATRKDVAALRAHADSLERDSLALERLAREKYGLIREGERLYRFADGATTPGATASPAAPAVVPGRDSATARDTARRQVGKAPPGPTARRK